jgi:vitamin B12 transporter
MLRKLSLPFSFLAGLVGTGAGSGGEPTIEVTATRVAETVDASLAAVSVITRPDIDASHARI